MQGSGGALLPPVQKLVATNIFRSREGEEKYKSSPISSIKQKEYTEEARML
jgi:hypothetical protein